MILIWNDAKSFKRHIEAMRIFRHSHSAYAVDGALLRDIPAAYEIALSNGERMVAFLTDSKGNLIFVPIWKMATPPGSQN